MKLEARIYIVSDDNKRQLISESTHERTNDVNSPDALAERINDYALCGDLCDWDHEPVPSGQSWYYVQSVAGGKEQLFHIEIQEVK